MNQIRPMLDSHPAMVVDAERLARTLEALFACATACAVCADACLAEPTVDSLRGCIALDQTCADVCMATALALVVQSRETLDGQHALLEACVAACTAAAASCEGHAARMEHCRRCAEACRACAAECRHMLEVLDRAGRRAA